MNKILAFLETLGRDARLAQSSATELASAARAAGVEPMLAEALARRDHVEFKRLFSALLLSLGLAMPPPGHALVFAPNEAELPAAPEEEAPAYASTPASAPASTPASTPASDLPAAGSGEAEPAPEVEVEGNLSEGSEDDAAPLDENTKNGDGPADSEAFDEAVDESSEDDESAEADKDIMTA